MRLTTTTTNGHAAETEVRQVLDDFLKAVRRGDTDAIMSYYADDMTAFDMMPPLQFKDKERYKRLAWEDCFTSYFDFPVDFEMTERRIRVQGDLAVSYGIAHMRGVARDGSSLGAVMRNTTLLQKIGGRWLITHEHNSVPLDKETGVGVMDLGTGDVSH